MRKLCSQNHLDKIYVTFGHFQSSFVFDKQSYSCGVKDSPHILFLLSPFTSCSTFIKTSSGSTFIFFPAGIAKGGIIIKFYLALGLASLQRSKDWSIDYVCPISLLVLRILLAIFQAKKEQKLVLHLP